MKTKPIMSPTLLAYREAQNRKERALRSYWGGVLGGLNTKPSRAFIACSACDKQARCRRFAATFLCDDCVPAYMR